MKDDDAGLVVIDTDNAITIEELRELKELVSNYRAAKIGVTAVLAFGGIVAAILHFVRDMKP
jgi:hypothetical protein